MQTMTETHRVPSFGQTGTNLIYVTFAFAVGLLHFMLRPHAFTKTGNLKISFMFPIVFSGLNQLILTSPRYEPIDPTFY